LKQKIQIKLSRAASITYACLRETG